MSTRRERAKEPAAKLNKQLAEMEETARLKRETDKRNLRKAEIYTGLANMVFAGIIIGGLFESTQYKGLLYLGGIIGFAVFMALGNRYFDQGIKEI